MAAKKSIKRPHKTLTIHQKLSLLDDIDKKSYTVLCDEYGIGRSTISSIKKQDDELREYKIKMLEMGFKRPTKTMKLSYDEELEKAVYFWFIQKREEGIPISGPILQAKVRVLNQQIQEQRIESSSKVLLLQLVGFGDFVNVITFGNYLFREKYCQQTSQVLVSLFSTSIPLSRIVITALYKYLIAMRLVYTISFSLRDL